MTAALNLPRPGPRPDGRASVLESGNVGLSQLVAPLTGHRGGLARDAAPALAVAEPLHPLLPHGLPRGATVAVRGSISLALALIGAASAEGAWTALVGLPPVSVEAAAAYGIDTARLALVPQPGAEWSTAVGALVDAVEVVVVRVPVHAGRGVPDAVIRRLSARARSKDAVLIPFLSGSDDQSGRGRWPGADLTVTATARTWTGLTDDAPGHGRLRGRLVELAATGRGRHARRRTAHCWLPAADGGIRAPDPAEVANQSAAGRPVPAGRSQATLSRVG